jgi:hypothetical protein
MKGIQTFFKSPFFVSMWQLGIGRINFAAVAMEIKNQGFNFFLNFFHQTS